MNLEHVEIKGFLWISPSEFVICVGKTQLVTRSKSFNLVKPKARKQVRHWCVGPNDERPFWYICQKISVSYT